MYGQSRRETPGVELEASNLEIHTVSRNPDIMFRILYHLEMKLPLRLDIQI